MAQRKINPIALRLAIKNTWWSINHNNWPKNILYEDFFIRKLINGMMKAYNIYSSEVIIKRQLNEIKIDFIIFRNQSFYNQTNSFKVNPFFPHNLISSYNQFHNSKPLNYKFKKSNFNINTSLLPANQVKLAKSGFWKFINFSKKSKNSSHLKQNFYYLHGNSEFRLYYLVNYLKFLIESNINKKVILNITEAPSLASNSKIFGDWISDQIKQNPNKYKFIVRKAIRSYIYYFNHFSTSPNVPYSHSSFINSFTSLLKNDQFINQSSYHR